MTTTNPQAAPDTQADLPPQYQPADVEAAMRARWDDAKAWHAEPGGDGDPYSIVIPPPNVTAALHLGHALNNTLQDVLIRYHRMLGRNTLWMPGTDHAGIATQTVVEKRVLAEEGKRRTDFKRDEFVQKIEAWKDEYEQRITDQLKEMGCSCDWDRQRFTMDDPCAKAVREAFFQLFKDGLIYRGKRLVNWDPVTQTALADDEVEMQDVDGQFYYMNYPIVARRGQGAEGSRGQEDSEHSAPGPLGPWAPTGEYVTVATTRPETMLGDTAVAVNPADPQRAKLIGKRVRLPIVNRVIPIVGDDYVVIPDPESDDGKARMASGFLKVTPAHDPNDFEIGQRHDLPIINVMAPDASISKDHGWPQEEWDPTTTPATTSAPTPKPTDAQRSAASVGSGGAETPAPVDPVAHELLGLSREDARKAIVRYFRDHDLLADQKPYRHAVGHSYRSHVPVEPYYTDQWYVKVTDDRLAGAALDALADDQRQPSEGCAWRKIDPVAPLDAQAMREQAENEQDWHGKLRFYPDRYAKTFQNWHENIRDWCISRQLWWGHRIPVWHKRVELDESNWVDELAGKTGLDSIIEGNWDSACVVVVRTSDGVSVDPRQELMPVVPSTAGEYDIYICVKSDDDMRDFEAAGFTQDPDVLDTWFSSGLWPLSTMGWPDVEGNDVLATWNPTQVLCTAREIITLWVSRMTMFNVYFHGRLPFHDVFIHAMIQDGHGQKMSKSLGNGVDPMDIIHSHGSDAMRYTLTAMTTQTQDVRMPVDCIDPHTPGNGETFTPRFITASGGVKVMAPIQERNGRKMVTSYGVASGEATPTGDTPLARNTSEKFDVGQRFANKLWNAVRFALSNLNTLKPQDCNPGASGDLTVADRWILSRLARTVRAVNESLREYQFAPYAQGLYDFIWRDLCDWYIEAVKPTVRQNPDQQRVLAACIDASLRLLHPVMPFVTERLWEGLNNVAPVREVEGLALPSNDLLMTAAWPRAQSGLIDEDAERDFELIRAVVSAVREVRSTHNVPPRKQLETTCRAPGPIAQKLLEFRTITTTLANTVGRGVGPQAEKPADAAVVIVGDCELYIHGLVDQAAECERLGKRRDELEKAVANLDKRLANKNYVDKAPADLVQETRDQRADAAKELEIVRQQIEALGG